MSKAIIHIAYDGPALEAGSMDVRELAPALVAISDLFEETNDLLNGEKATVNVNVKAEFKAGSFEIVLELIQKISEQLKNIFELSEGVSAKALVEAIGLTAGTAVSILQLIKWLRGRKIKKVIVLDNGNFRIEAEGPYDAIEVSERTIKLYRNKRVRQAMKNMIAPLDKDGVDTFIVREEKKEVHRIGKEEKAHFAVPEIEDEEILDVTRKGAFNVIGVFFEERLKWKLYDGENRINATIKDQHFLDALDKGRVSFTKGDILEVELRTQQWKTEKGLKTEHEVIKVIKQHKAYEQLPLPFESQHIGPNEIS